MGTATQLIPAFVDAEPLEFAGREYSKNMRPIRGYPDYWRIIDTEDIVDGPPSQGQLYTRDLFLWQAEVLKDENQDFTDTIEAVNLGDYLTFTTSEVSGNTEYRYKYTSGVENFQYQHTDVIDSVSLEFDQLGRRIVSFESMGNVYLLWFDPVAGGETLTDFGAGYNPVITTDTYVRVGDANSSERLLFYVKDSTKQIVYRRQDDRYTVEYALPSAPADVVEILKVSKNIYGGLTVLYCYESAGELVTGSFTAVAGTDTPHIGTDGSPSSEQTITVSSGTLDNFNLKVAAIVVENLAQTSILPAVGSLTNFFLGIKTVDTEVQTDTSSVAVESNSGTLSNFNLSLQQTTISPDVNSQQISVGSTSGALNNFTFKVALITVDSTIETSSVALGSSSGSLNNFILG